ncbi:MAG TPA: protein kinase, partial [Pyrinomonadaceae bacterium]|nr:protein kinase [Pyrinomonadaceae bacterium]
MADSPMDVGTTISHYRITAKIGEGGMGEVYRARDLQLGRDVAIKVLPSSVSDNADRLRRFELEAQSTSELNHPNILTIFDIGSHNGSSFMVSELLEGETLREHLQTNTLAPRRATDYAVQIARGLAAAHERGVVHRDLKPENIFITADGRVKILDFGLAKLVEPTEQVQQQTNVPTRKVGTEPGTVMGTVGYMSPEQAAGRPVDHRADIFSFGAVLYEMLSGARAFHRDTAIETLNAILKEDPQEFSATTTRVIPPALESVVWHCLEKKPERRFQSASDAAFALEALSGRSVSSSETIIKPVAVRGANRERLTWIAACSLLAIAAAVLGFLYFTRPQTSARPIRLAVATPEKASLPGRIEISPDGTRVAFLANNSEGKRLIWVRQLDSANAQQLTGTEGANSPFWSPDSRSLGYFAYGKLYRVDAAGGRPQVLCDVGEIGGGAWSPDGTILFGGNDGLFKVSAQGGSPTLATKVAEKEEAHRWPYLLPDGRHFVFLADAERTEDHNIRVGSFDSTESQILFPAITRIAYSPPGYLLYVSQGALVAHPFNVRTLKTTGDPMPITEHIAQLGGNHEFDFSVSNNGVLAYQSGNPNSQLTWFDPEGKKLGTVGEPADYSTVALSPDERRAALGLLDADGRASDLWVTDVVRGNLTRLTFDPQSDSDAIWSPDGSQIVFSSNRAGDGFTNLFLKASGGASEEQVIVKSEATKFPTDWSRDGTTILFESWLKGGAIWTLTHASDWEAKPFLQSTNFSQIQGVFSPDGRFIAYVSDESGRLEVYVQTFPTSGNKWQVSTAGGVFPRWRRDGKEL